MHRRVVRILAHRGSPGTSAIENTVAAVSSALAEGASGVEVDLRASADGVLVLSHDADLSRLTGSAVPVAEAPWELLRTTADAAGVPLARLEWVLAAAAGRAVVLELKAPPPAPSARARTVDALVARLCGLHSAGLPLEVTVSSFDPALVQLFRAEAPAQLRTRTALLGRPGCHPNALLRQALADGHDEVHPHVLDVLARPRSVDAARSCGLAVVPWTVNRRRAVRRCADLGVSAVITDVPVVAHTAVLARRTAA